MGGNAEGEKEDSTINRRRLLETLSVMSGVGLAGCEGIGNGGGNGTGGNGNQELGERVPTVTMSYWANIGGLTTIQETIVQIVQSNLDDRLGVNVEINPTEVSSHLAAIAADRRIENFSLWLHPNDPSRLDPQEYTRQYSVDEAGNTGGTNPPNYANCEFTDPAIQQEQASSVEERRNLVNEAQGVMSRDMATMPIFPFNTFFAARTDKIELNSLGDAGFTEGNPPSLADAEIIGSSQDAWVTNTSPITLESNNYPTNGSSSALLMWNHIVNSTLTEYDENYNLQPMLAESFEYTNEGETLTVNLRDAEFHNGDPITSEDVAFTFNYIRDNPRAIPLAVQYPIDSIDTPDEKTAVFNFSSAYLPMVGKSFARWGIMNKDIWEPARDDPEGFEWDPMVGSGPYQVSNFESGQSLRLEPFDGHPVHDPNNEVVYRVYRDAQSTQQAFQAGELDVATGLGLGIADQIESNMPDRARVYTTKGFMPHLIYPQTHIAPFKFRPFRNAVGTAINRQEMAQVAMKGRAEPELYSCPFMKSHPWRPPDDVITQFTDNPAGDEDVARQALMDAGYGWDDNGNLHYPPDTDTSPRWPEEERPTPDDFPCINEDYEWVPPEERN